MSLSATQHLKHEARTTGVSNAIFNGLIAWLLLRNGPALAWSGDHSFVVDIVFTALLLPFIVALIVIPLQRRKLRNGTLQPVDLGPDSLLQAVADRLPHGTFASALVFGALGLCLIAPLTVLGFFIVGITQVAPTAYAIFKGVWAGVMAAVIVLPMVLVALRAHPVARYPAATFNSEH